MAHNNQPEVIEEEEEWSDAVATTNPNYSGRILVLLASYFIHTVGTSEPQQSSLWSVCQPSPVVPSRLIGERTIHRFVGMSYLHRCCSWAAAEGAGGTSPW